MNLHGLVRSAIKVVNPDIVATVNINTGYTQDANYNRTPTFTPKQANIQVQAVTEGDLQKTGGLNLQGVQRSVYLYGHWQGVVRADAKGGDTMKFPEYPCGPVHTWLITHVIESWPDWTKVLVTMQVV
jgi:hypothetical protein